MYESTLAIHAVNTANEFTDTNNTTFFMKPDIRHEYLRTFTNYTNTKLIIN